MHPNVYSSTINNSQSMEGAQCPSMDEWIKMWYTCMYMDIYIHTMEYYSAMKRDEILPFATTWMELECIMLSEIKERQKYAFTHMRTLRDKTDEHKGKKNIKTGKGDKTEETHKYGEQTGLLQGLWEGG